MTLDIKMTFSSNAEGGVCSCHFLCGLVASLCKVGASSYVGMFSSSGWVCDILVSRVLECVRHMADLQ